MRTILASLTGRRAVLIAVVLATPLVTTVVASAGVLSPFSGKLITTGGVSKLTPTVSVTPGASLSPSTVAIPGKPTNPITGGKVISAPGDDGTGSGPPTPPPTTAS